eukprot:6180965-Pleurochrysis_carterae.AAC.2
MAVSRSTPSRHARVRTPKAIMHARTVIFRRPRLPAKTLVRLFSADEERMVDRLNPPFKADGAR